MGASASCRAKLKVANQERANTSKLARLQPHDTETAKFAEERKSVVSDHLSSLRHEDHLGDAQVQRIKEHMSEMLSVCKPELVRRFRPLAKSTHDPPLEKIVNEVLDVFSGLETANQEFAYLSSKVPYITPVEHIFGIFFPRTQLTRRASRTPRRWCGTGASTCLYQR